MAALVIHQWHRVSLVAFRNSPRGSLTGDSPTSASTRVVRGTENECVAPGSWPLIHPVLPNDSQIEQSSMSTCDVLEAIRPSEISSVALLLRSKPLSKAGVLTLSGGNAEFIRSCGVTGAWCRCTGQHTSAAGGGFPTVRLLCQLP